MPELVVIVRLDATPALLALLGALTGAAVPVPAPAVEATAEGATAPPDRPKGKRRFSPEFRAAAAERMRAWQAARKRERETKAGTDVAPAVAEKTPAEAPPTAPAPPRVVAPEAPGEVDYNTAFRWAAERGLASVRHGMDMERVNAERAKHGLAPFVLRKRGAA